MMRIGVTFLRNVVPLYFIAAEKVVTDGVLNGAVLMTSFVFSPFSDLLQCFVPAKTLSMTALGSTGI